MRLLIATPVILLLTAFVATDASRAAETETPNLRGKKLYLNGERFVGPYTLDVVRQPCSEPELGCEGEPYCSIFQGGCYTYTVKLVADDWHLEFDLTSYLMTWHTPGGPLSFDSYTPTGAEVHTLVVDGTPILPGARECESAGYVSGTVERIDRKITVRMFVGGPTNHDYYDYCGRRSAAVDFSTRIQLER